MSDSPMYAATVPVFKRMLGNLSGLLGKARAHAASRGYEADVLLQQRLFPDMFPLTRQVQMACDAAKLAAARLSGMSAPVHEDVERTFAELDGRIAATLAFLDGVPAPAFADAATRIVTLKMRDRSVELTGERYLFDVALPNFFFHVTTAYNLLRHNGVEIGKRDFLGALD